ncbi:MAG: hypothetical protein PHI41_04255 [Erysipelotrichaceae bacterium]|nr:hypothetical protein [Erysipelotrichaceae bacterium]
MKNISIIIKNGLIVTGGSLVSLAVAYGIYVFLFLTVREMAIQAGTFDLISKVRIIYGISAILICALIYRTRLIGWIKASVLAGALATMMISIGVQMYEFKPFFFAIMILAVGLSVYLIHRMDLPWYHYYAILISILATLFYL